MMCVFFSFMAFITLLMLAHAFVALSYSTTVVFEKPAEPIVRKWQLACVGNIAHVVVMPSVDTAKLDEFFADYVQSREVCGWTCR